MDLFFQAWISSEGVGAQVEAAKPFWLEFLMEFVPHRGKDNLGTYIWSGIVAYFFGKMITGDDNEDIDWETVLPAIAICFVSIKILYFIW